MRIYRYQQHFGFAVLLLFTIDFDSQRVTTAYDDNRTSLTSKIDEVELASSLALKASPTAVLNLRNATESDERCVTLMSHTLCTRIANCSVEESGYSITETSGGYSMGISPPGCNVSVSFNDGPCVEVLGRITFAEEPYFITAAVNCGGIIQVGTSNTGAGCSGDSPRICAKGSHVNSFQYGEGFENRYDLFVEWDCADDINISSDIHRCTCSANLYPADPCASCSVCKNEDFGAFSLTCNGFSVDCDHNYTFSGKILLDSSTDSIMRIQKPLFWLTTFYFWTLLL